MPVLKKIALPDYYYNDNENRTVFWQGIKKNFPVASRKIPDALTKAMAEAVAAGENVEYFIPHWHHLTVGKDEDSRSIRNFLRADHTGLRPKYPNTRDMDFLRYADICLQAVDSDYRAYVQNWCWLKTMCIGEDDF